ncbi:MAG: excinuclease ABC subunit UvrA [Planctomycetes bacterium]|nr:excinuclease ABC subunit UvrA [Planctomycetota bacterium]
MPTNPNIALHGVRVHNLKNIDVEIPLHRLTVVTGVCGAGKSSLVFDTLYAEAQRRYLQSFSAYTRQFLERFDQPDAERIGDVPPAIAIGRHAARTSARATVASLIEIDFPLRLLFTRAGELTCPSCDFPVTSHRAADVVNAIAAMPIGTRCTLAFPAFPGAPTEQASWQAALLEEGYIRIHAGGVAYRLGEQTVPILPEGQPIWIVQDRVEVGKTPGERLTESVEAAYRRGLGRVGCLTDMNDFVYDQRPVCARCQRVLTAPAPRLFDPADPLGACSTCKGTGRHGKNVEVCPACSGRRWNADALAARVGGCDIAQWHSMPVDELAAFVQSLPGYESTRLLIQQSRTRLETLSSLDLGYLTLGDPIARLPDGVVRRIQLAAALTSNLVQVLYVLDEPTLGLHPRDTEKLLAALTRLRERGNTVVVIEHDRAVIAAADHVIDLGPGAGDDGGNVAYQGSPRGLASAAAHPTSDFWTGRGSVGVPSEYRKPAGVLKLTGANANNLQDLTVEFPLGVFCVITGVSGAGKRSLIEQSLHPALCHAKKKKTDRSTTAKITGAGQLADVLLLDQTTLPRSSRSNPATYLKIFDDIRAVFAETVDAKIRNFGPGHFSFNQPGGRCETCEGQGTLVIDMQFLADVTATCPECLGRRYRKEILDIKVRSRSIAEVLDLTVREAFRFFRAQPKIEKKLKVLIDVGLDHLRLGQAVETLAGGECQRLKLAGQLAASKRGACLFLLIEPSAGLHSADIANLLDCIDRLLSAGHSLIAIESDLDVIVNADYVIDLGPAGGRKGGRVVAQGTPEEVAQAAESFTGQCLKNRG